MKKNIFVLSIILSFIIFSSFGSYAYDKDNMPTMIKVGLMYGDKSTALVNLHSSSGFEFGSYIDNQFHTIYNMMDYTDIIIRKNGYFMGLNNSYIETNPGDASIGPYHVQVEGNFNDLYEVQEFINSLSNNESLYPAYDNGWKVWAGPFLNESKAQGFINDNNENSNNLQIIYPNGKIIQVLNTKGNIIFVYNTGDKEFYFRSFLEKDSNNIIKLNGKNFRGEMLLRRLSDGGLTVINYLNIQEYLYGVLPKEMSGEWPLEALKAQAVAARNYAVANIGKHSNYGFDVCAEVDCQVYGGYDIEKPRSNKAVDDTYGTVLTYNGNLVSAFFHANSGGHTENSENIWSISLPYIRGIKDDFSIGQPNSTWTQTYSPQEIGNILSKNGINVGKVLDMYPESISPNGRILSLVIKGSRDEVKLQKEKTRAIFGYNNVKSMWFEVDTDGSSYVLSDNNISKKSINSMYIIKENSIVKIPSRENYKLYNGSKYIAISGSPNQFILKGKGWGHGLGMSQWGAKKMAEMGYSYEDILKHYYSGTKLE